MLPLVFDRQASESGRLSEWMSESIATLPIFHQTSSPMPFAECMRRVWESLMYKYMIYCRIVEEKKLIIIINGIVVIFDFVVGPSHWSMCVCCFVFFFFFFFVFFVAFRSCVFLFSLCFCLFVASSLVRSVLVLFLPHFYVMTKPSHPIVTQWHCSHIILDVGSLC